MYCYFCAKRERRDLDRVIQAGIGSSSSRLIARICFGGMERVFASRSLAYFLRLSVMAFTVSV